METNNITYLLIEQYIRGTLDEKTMHELERKALDDPFLADALEGYSHTEGPSASQLSLLQKQLQDRIDLQQQKKTMFHFSWQRISVGAAACLLFIVASILFWMKGSRNQPEIFPDSEEKAVNVTLMDPDSAKALVSSGKERIAVAVRPEGGWNAFSKYLEENKKSAVSGSVTVEFEVNGNGRPEHIRVIRSSSEKLHKEALRLISNGPDWLNSGQEKVVVNVEF